MNASTLTLGNAENWSRNTVHTPLTLRLYSPRGLRTPPFDITSEVHTQWDAQIGADTLQALATKKERAVVHSFAASQGDILFRVIFQTCESYGLIISFRARFTSI